MYKVHIIIAIWGEEFINDFLKFSLPGQLSDGNLKYIKENKIPCIYKIFTLTNNVNILNNSYMLKKLKKIIPTEIKLIDIYHNDKYQMMSRAHNQAIIEANKERAALIFISPDIVIADGAFKYIIQAMKKGKRVLLLPNIRVNKETFIKHFRTIKNKILTSRELMNIALDHIHPFCRNLFLNNKLITAWPSHLYYRIGKKNILIKSFHSHPIFVYPENIKVLSRGPIDGSYADKACPNIDLWEFIDDSDKIGICDFTSADITKYKPHNIKNSIFFLIWWIKNHTNKNHRFFAKKTHYLHANNKIEINQHLKKLNRYINIILFCCQIKYLFLFLEIKYYQTYQSSTKNFIQYIFSKKIKPLLYKIIFTLYKILKKI